MFTGGKKGGGISWEIGIDTLLLLFGCSVMPNSFAALLNVDCWVSLSTGFPRQEYWSGLPFLPPTDLPNPRIKPKSPALASGVFTTEPAMKLKDTCSLEGKL